MVKAAAESKTLPRVIYHPLEDGDPFSTVWNRHRFEANIPVTLKDIKGGYTAEDMLALARKNKYFEIEGEGKKEATKHSEPTDADQYRAHAVRWMRAATSAQQLVSRWESEQELRDECGVGKDDEDYLGTLFNPKKKALEEAANIDNTLIEA